MKVLFRLTHEKIEKINYTFLVFLGGVSLLGSQKA